MGRKSAPQDLGDGVPTQAVFYRDIDGREPVKEFLLQKLTLKSLQLVEEQIDEMNELQDDLPPLSFPGPHRS